MPAYIKTVIFHDVLISAAAEHGARRRAMQSATDNAENVLGALSRTKSTANARAQLPLSSMRLSVVVLQHWRICNVRYASRDFFL